MTPGRYERRIQMRVAAFPSHLDSNPYCDLLYDHIRHSGTTVTEGGPLSLGWLLKNRASVDLLHFHWIERYYRHWRGGVFSYIALLRFVLLITAARALGYRLVWTMHNVAAHESTNPRIDRLAAAFFARRAVTAAHCAFARDLLLGLVPGARVHVIEHGSYAGVYDGRRTRDAARERLELERGAVVLLFFGMIRRYKGLESLCEAFAQCAGPGAILLIAGKPYEHAEAAMVEDLMRRYRSSSIRFVPEFIPDDAVADYFLASDYCVFPYEDVLTSGSVILSLGFGRPILAPRIGCLSEMEGSDVGIFYDARDGAGLKTALRTALRNERWSELAGNAASYADGLRWEAIAKKYGKLYESA